MLWSTDPRFEHCIHQCRTFWGEADKNATAELIPESEASWKLLMHLSPEFKEVHGNFSFVIWLYQFGQGRSDDHKHALNLVYKAMAHGGVFVLRFSTPPPKPNPVKKGKKKEVM
jgi:hypothetical protein